MSVYIDRKYALMIAPKLLMFKQKKDYLWNFRCPFCMDSKKNKTKARGYFYRQKVNIFFICHNCGTSCALSTFLKKFDPVMFQEYQMECFQESASGAFVKKPDLSIFTTQPNKRSQPVMSKTCTINLPTVASLPTEHPAKQYILGRNIPECRMVDLYYAENFLTYTETVFPIEKEVPSDQRIVIPFFDRDGHLMGVQGRAISNTKMRYITLKAAEGFRKVYGLEKVDLTKTIYVVEGPIDSLFLPNCLATMDSNLAAIRSIAGDYDYVLVFDNQPRNAEICKQIQRAINANFKIVVWPATIDAKDLNDMILNGVSEAQLLEIIKENTFDTLKAQLKFNDWKKV